MAGVIAAAVVVGWAIVAPRRVVVEGRSMEPTLLDKDHLLVARVGRVRPGDLVALRDPRDRRRLLVKRVASVGAGSVRVLGDNPPASTDSRHFGAVPKSYLLGRVLRRYSPAERAGWLR